MVIKTKRIDSKHVLVLEAPDVDYNERINAKVTDLDIYMAKRLASGGLEQVPDDEPTITFRGRDRLALSTLYDYRERCQRDHCTHQHLQDLNETIGKFEDFVRQHPDRMKQPGSTRGMSSAR